MLNFKLSTHRKRNSSSPFVTFIVGIIFVLTAPALIYWNESRAVARTQALNEGQLVVRSISSESTGGENEGSLVHISGLVTTEDILEDALFDVSVQAISLWRTVEMYQWKEKSSKRDDDSYRYSYEKGWFDEVIDSGSFRESGHSNPSEMAISPSRQTARTVTLGSLVIGNDFISQMDRFEAVSVGDEVFPEVDGLEPSVHGNQVHYEKRPGSTEIGDLRVTFRAVKPDQMSVIGKLQKDKIVAYVTSGGESLAFLASGTVSAEQMFADEHSDNTRLTWIVRGAVTLMMFIGFICIMSPITRLLSWVPGLGTVAEAGAGTIAIVLTIVFSSLVIGLSWLAVRPVMSIAFFAASILAFFFLRRSPKRAAVGNEAGTTIVTAGNGTLANKSGPAVVGSHDSSRKASPPPPPPPPPAG